MTLSREQLETRQLPQVVHQRHHLRRQSAARLLIALLVFVWAATPHPYDDGHLAPAFVVFAFRWLLEDGANPRPPFAMLVLATILVLVLCGAAKGVTAFRRRTPSTTPVRKR